MTIISMNENDIKKIVEELCATDRTLRGKERELTELVRKLAVKPNVERDPDFLRTLRTQLIAELSLRETKNRTAPAQLFTSRSWNFVFSGVAVILVAFVAWFGFSALHPQNGQNSVALVSTPTITRVGDRAFGSISAPAVPRTVVAPKAMNALIAQPLAAPVSATGEVPGTAPEGGTTSSAASTGGENANAKVQMMSASPIAIAPSIKYVYQGKTFSTSDARVDVLKRTTSTLSLGDVAAAFGRAGFGFASTSSFGNAAVTNLTFAQNEDFGYEVTIDLLNGTVSINPNFSRWPLDDGGALPKSLPSSSVIGIVDQFFKDHAIPLANYGDPHAENNGAMASVFYPEVVSGLEVYSANGEKIGLTVEVNVRYKRVENVQGLTSQNYDASSYAAIVDAAKIVSLAEQGAGSAAAMPEGPVKKVGLGTPVRAYAEEGDGLLVPAFAFPVMGGVDTANSVVIVPLVKD